jgi:hypothetical protein
MNATTKPVTGPVESPVLCEGHAGFGRRLGETHRWKHQRGAPSRPHPHRALQLEAPDHPAGRIVAGEEQEGTVRRRDLRCGLLHEYRRAA